MNFPVLYSFRRCPYAIRARMALKYAGCEIELRDILLKNKPQQMLDVSPKGTVPVLVLPSGRVIDESLDIMLWALQGNDPDGWLNQFQMAETMPLIQRNDGEFKQNLDRYKYADRFPEQSAEYYRQQGEVFLSELESKLQWHHFLAGESMSLVDVAIFPFIRQWASVNMVWFEQSPYTALRKWLDTFLSSALFTHIMKKQSIWAADTPSVRL